MKITELFAFICTEDDGGDGVPAIRVGDIALPLMGSDTKRMECLRQAAQDAANMTGRPVRLAVFRNMEVIETIQPKPSASANNKEMNCYTCQYRRTRPGSEHSVCLNLTAHVAAEDHGINNGWFNWPLDYDPAWLKACDGWTRLRQPI